MGWPPDHETISETIRFRPGDVYETTSGTRYLVLAAPEPPPAGHMWVASCKSGTSVHHTYA